MISSAVQDGLYVRAIGTDGSTLYTRKGELLGFTSVSVTVRDGNTIYICGQDGRTQSTRSYQGGRTAYDDLLEAEKNRPSIKWSKGVCICYLLFGWLIKIGAVYRLYQSLGKTYLTVGEGGSELGIVRWKDVGIWLMSVIFWIGCFWCYYEFKAWMN